MASRHDPAATWPMIGRRRTDPPVRAGAGSCPSHASTFSISSCLNGRLPVRRFETAVGSMPRRLARSAWFNPRSRMSALISSMSMRQGVAERLPIWQLPFRHFPSCSKSAILACSGAWTLLPTILSTRSAARPRPLTSLERVCRPCITGAGRVFPRPAWITCAALLKTICPRLTSPRLQRSMVSIFPVCQLRRLRHRERLPTFPSRLPRDHDRLDGGQGPHP